MNQSQAVMYRFTCASLALLATTGCGEVESPPGSPATESNVSRDAGSTRAEAIGELAPVDPEKVLEDAEAALDAGDADTARKLARTAISLAPDDPQTVFLMARVLAARNRFREAIKLLDDFAKEAPEARLPALGQTAEWLVLDGDWLEAEQRYRSLLVEAPTASLVDRMLAQLLLRQGRRSEAATHLRKLCRAGDVVEAELRAMLNLVHPLPGETITDETEPIGTMGRVRYEISQGNWDAALKELDQSSSKRPAEAALRGRIYAHQQDFESLAKWVSDAPESGKETADDWFAMAVYEAHRGDHQAAVKAFCAAVLRDQTDAEAYLLMSQSLAELKADAEAQEASKRAQLIAQTQLIGNQLAASSDREAQTLTTLIDLLDQLQRPMEALAWRAVHVVYGQSSSASSNQAAMQALQEINRHRLQRLQAGDTDATEHFLLCGVDLDSLRGIDDADAASASQE